MRNYISLLILLFFQLPFKSINAQVYAIPGATQQPAWVFPIWFENAIGEKDTIYIGYDSTAYNDTQPGFSGDSVFGEKLIKIDTSKFNMSICSYILNNDSIVKVMVTSDLNLTSMCGDGSFELYAIHGWLPIKMSWDVSLFRSNSLPFPDLSPAPRVQGLIWFDGDASDLSGTCFSWGDNPLVITDSIDQWGGFESCVRKDSVVFTSLWSLSLQIVPWQGYWVNVKEKKQNQAIATITPNPFRESVTIRIQDIRIQNQFFILYNLFGTEVKRLSIINSELILERGNLQSGIYFYKIVNYKDVIQIGKLIVQ